MPVSSTDILDDELVKMAAFKLGETARRVALLAKEAETPGLRKLLAASSVALNQQAQELCVGARELEEHSAMHAEGPATRGRPPRPRLRLADDRAPRLAARG